MLRAFLDVNVIVSAALSPAGTPASLLDRSWSQGEFELLVSPLLLAELGRSLTYPKLVKRIATGEARELIEWLEIYATVVTDPQGPPPVRSADPGDDYLLALGAHAQAIIVTGDGDLLGLAEDIPVLSPASFMRLVEDERDSLT